MDQDLNDAVWEELIQGDRRPVKIREHMETTGKRDKYSMGYITIVENATPEPRSAFAPMPGCAIDPKAVLFRNGL